MTSTPSAGQAGRTSKSGALGADEVVAKNVQRLRLERDWSQTDVAVRMQALDHSTWTQTIVSRFERLLRPIGLSELFALAVVFELSPVQLLDVGAAHGTALDLGGPGELGAEAAAHWVKGRKAPHLTWDGKGYVAGSMAWVWLPRDEWTNQRDERIRQLAEKPAAE